MDQPVPKVSRADVERIVRRDFSIDQFDNVMSILDEYGTEKWEKESGQARVQLAILKLADKNFDKLRQFLSTAKNDFRDVLVHAEYPEAWQHGFEIEEKVALEERGRIYGRDWKQYEIWLSDK